MRTLLALLILTLISILDHSAAVLDAVKATSERSCCGNFTKKVIPMKLLKTKEETPQDCSIHAIIVTTVQERKYCINPKSDYAKRLEKLWPTLSKKPRPADPTTSPPQQSGNQTAPQS